VNLSAMAARPLGTCIVHTSTSQIGGAERSLLEAVSLLSEKPIFLVPSEGPLTQALTGRGLSFRVLGWPPGLASMTQSRWYALPLVLIGLPVYLIRLYAATRPTRMSLKNSGTVWSSGLKSHGACLLLSPWMGSDLLFDIRDFLRPVFLRKIIAFSTVHFGSRVRVNSKAVGQDYPGCEVIYPVVKLVDAPVNRRKKEGKRIIVHLAYFAPYKGQDLFLSCARKMLDAGVDAEFWMVGEVIYPAQAYINYREKIFLQAKQLGLAEHVKFLGKVSGMQAVQALLEQTHLLLHCTREPEPFGRAVLEALACGAEVICHRGSGVCEVVSVIKTFPKWVDFLADFLGPEYVQLSLTKP
jgi:glycosyltransferase involved in cell wall biosynthesis